MKRAETRSKEDMEESRKRRERGELGIFRKEERKKGRKRKNASGRTR